MITVLIVPVETESDVVVARGRGREIARSMGFGVADQTRLATAISELTRNIIRYAEKGTCTFLDDSSGGVKKLRVVTEDTGPGIADIEKAMGDGFSTSGSLGAGLPGTKRLVDEFAIESNAQGTRITITMLLE